MRDRHVRYEMYDRSEGRNQALGYLTQEIMHEWRYILSFLKKKPGQLDFACNS